MPDLSKVTAILPDLADWLVYGAIAVVTLIGFFKCLVPLWKTTHALHRAITRLQADAGRTTGKPVWQEPRFVGKRLQGSWMRFLQNAEQLDRRGLPTNVEDYINDDTVTHGPGNATLAELIPGLLTSLGILGTFMGLSRGLSSLNFADASQLIAGIPDLLGGMRFAFGTSVAGISCSLVFNMLNRISQGSSYRAIDEFVNSFTQLAMSRPLDNDVQMIIQNQDRNYLLRTMNDSMVDRLAETVGRAMTRSMAPVTDSMDRFIVAATRNQIDGVNRIVTRFLQEMDQSLGGQFSSLSAAMESLTARQGNLTRQTDQTLASAAAIVNNAQMLEQMTARVLGQFDTYVEKINAYSVRDENFENHTAELLSRMQDQNRDLTVLINSLTEKIRLLPDLSAPGAETSLKEIKEVTSSLNRNLESISETLSALSAKEA